MSAPQIDKEGLRNYILSLSEQFGIETAKNELMDLLKESSKDLRGYDKQLFYDFRGELGEILLEMYLLKYVKDNPKSFFTKSLCIKRHDAGSHSGYSDYTELDVTLFTEGQIVLFECKCYGGEKSLTDKCTINRVGLESKDVASQSVHHLKYLTYYTQPFQRDKSGMTAKPYKIVYFELSLDITTDLRTQENQDRFPYVTESNIEDFLNKLPKQRAWKMDYVFNRISDLDAQSKDNMKEHLKQLGAKRQ